MQYSNLYFLLIFIHYIHSSKWNYHELGPDIWSDSYPACAGRFQSPINIRTPCTRYKSFEPFRFSEAYHKTEKLRLKNTGQTIHAHVDDHEEASRLQLTGGGLNGTFEFVNLHLHWGENYKSGSEHQVNGRKYAGEIHFVHRNPETSQLAVLGVFMESYHRQHGIHHPHERTRHAWKKYMAIAKRLKKEQQETILNVTLSSLLGDELDEFWRYEGSLTTPPCTEGIIWTVFRKPIIFAEDQLENLRHEILFEVYRDPQQLYHRVVYRNFHPDASSSVPDFNLCTDTTKPSSLISSDFFEVSSGFSAFERLLVIVSFVFCAYLIYNIISSLKKNKPE